MITLRTVPALLLATMMALLPAGCSKQSEQPPKDKAPQGGAKAAAQPSSGTAVGNTVDKAVLGYWDGAISLPGLEMKFNAEFLKDKEGTLSGKYGIPAQGIRNGTLTNVEAVLPVLKFALPGIPGNPTFEGNVSGDGKAVEGKLTQNGQSFPFKLERKPKPQETTMETPESGVAGKGLAGFWQGSLKVAQVSELRLVLDMTNSAGKLSGVLVSVDQNNARVGLSNIEEQDGIHFEVPTIGGSFFGDLSTNGTEIEGQWRQMGRTTPITFKRLAKSPLGTK